MCGCCAILRDMRLQVSAYIPGTSPIHACDPRVKVVLLAIYTVALFWVDTFAGQGIFALMLLAVVLASRVSPWRLLRLGIPVYVLAALTVVFAAFNPATGIVLGCLYAIRVVLLVIPSFLVTFTTTSTQLVAALRWFLQPLRPVRVPVDDISMVFSLVVRFIPLTAMEFCQVRDAQCARGAHFSAGGPLWRFSTWGNVFIALFVQLFRRADRLAVAMDARCYGEPGVRRTSLARLRIDAASATALIIGAGILIAVAWLL